MKLQLNIRALILNTSKHLQFDTLMNNQRKEIKLQPQKMDVNGSSDKPLILELQIKCKNYFSYYIMTEHGKS